MTLTRRLVDKLVETAKRARTRAYCPYSRYPIGAAVLTEDGRIFSGANVENASYGLSLCAERVAVFSAVTRGAKGLLAVAVAGRSARPCGACRQVMLEFSSKETWLYTVDVAGDGRRRDAVARTRLVKTLPGAFDPLEAGLLPPNPQNLLRRRRKPGPAGRQSRRAGPRRALRKPGPAAARRRRKNTR